MKETRTAIESAGFLCHLRNHRAKLTLFQFIQPLQRVLDIVHSRNLLQKSF